MQNPLFFLLIPPCLVAVTAGLWVPILFWLRQRRNERRFTALAAELGCEAQGGSVRVPGFADRCTAHLQPAGRNTPPALEVTFSDRRDGSLEGPTILLRREGSVDRLGKALGLNREVQVGDAAFDRAVYVESDAPDAVLRWLLGDTTRRRAVLDVLDLGFDELTIHGEGSLLSAKRTRPTAAHLGAAVVRDVARCLSLLAPGIPAHDPRADASLRPSALRAALPGLLGLAGLIGVLVASVATFALRDAFRPITSDLYGVALATAGCLLAPGLLVVAITVRGHSDSFRTFVFAAVLLLFLMPPCTVSAFLVVNGAFDASAPLHHPSRVLDHSVTTGKNAGYHLQIAGLRRGDEPFRMDVDADTYQRVATSDAIVVTTGAGALGWEWIRRLDPARKK